MEEDIYNDLNINVEHEEYQDAHLIMRLPRRYIRDMQNPINFYDNRNFKKRYRFTKETVMETIMPLIEEHIRKPTRRGLPISPLLSLLVCLRFYSTGSFQTVCGDLRGISQSTISRIVVKVSTLIARKLPVYITFPTNIEEVRNVNRAFFDVANFPQVIGCIDCTHIPIKSPGGAMAEIYRNRKRTFSLNVQVIGGPNLEIFDIVARWPGREHDSMIFANSSAKARFEAGHLHGILLGDSGYPCLPYLMTPLLNPNNEAENRYNRAQIRTRNTVERLFGNWKRRFPCLSRVLTNKLETIPAIIVACGVLYNIGIRVRDIDEEQREIIDVEEEAHNPRDDNVGIGHAVRRALIERHFVQR